MCNLFFLRLACNFRFFNCDYITYTQHILLLDDVVANSIIIGETNIFFLLNNFLTSNAE